MAILNYTTSIAAEKTAMEIQAKLVAAKASAVMSEYEGGRSCGNCFRCTISEMGFFMTPQRMEG